VADEILFEVEHKHLLRGRDAYVFARQVDDGAWCLGDGATLGGRRIEPSASIPRALGPDGKQRLDLFVFKLVHRDDLACFEVGQQVMLQVGGR
jgi:hypothetical protein